MNGSHYSALLTELGIIIAEEGEEGVAVKNTFAFDDPVSDYLAIKSGKTPRSCRDLGPYLKSLESAISTGDEALLDTLKREEVDVQMLEGTSAESARASKQQLIIRAGLASDSRDAIEKLRMFAMGLSSSRVTEISSSADLHIIQAVNSLDEIDRVANALSSRIKEWYGLHFPELENIVDSIEGYARIVLAGRREVLTAESFSDAGFPSEKTGMMLIAASNSRGGGITDDSLGKVQSMARQLISSYELRRSLEALIEKEMANIAPNLAAILGTALSARMLARIGSIKRMAAMPASTIQVLGAERALFRSLKTGSEPPKHGLIFQHPMVHAAPRWQRGKIARAIAAKAAIAARVDVYGGGGGLNSTLLEKLNVRVNEIGEKFQEPQNAGVAAPTRAPGAVTDARYARSRANSRLQKETPSRSRQGDYKYGGSSGSSERRPEGRAGRRRRAGIEMVEGSGIREGEKGRRYGDGGPYASRKNGRADKGRKTGGKRHPPKSKANKQGRKGKKKSTDGKKKRSQRR